MTVEPHGVPPASWVLHQASEPMQKGLEHLMDFLMNHLSSEDKAYLWSVGSFWAS
jgi:hypothetical protein